MVVADGRQRPPGVGGAGDDLLVHAALFVAGNVQAPLQGEPGHETGDGLWVLANLVVEPAFEIAGDLDVHRGIDRGDHLSLGIDAGMEEPGQDVVFVGGQDQAADGKAHPLGIPAGEDVAEIARGDGELDPGGAGGVHDPESGEKVIDDLAQHPGPVDGVDGAQGMGVLERQVVEQRLHQELAVVKAAFHGQVEDIVVEHRSHLPLLQGADAAFGVHDENPDARLSADAGDGGGTGVAAGGGQDVQAAVPFLQDFLEQAAEKLQGDVLEGQRGAVEQLQHVHGAGRPDGGHVGMCKRRIGTGDQLAQAGFGDVIGEQADDFEGEIGVVEVFPFLEAVGHGRDAVGNEQAAVAGQPGHDGILESQGRLRASRADVADGFHSRDVTRRKGGTQAIRRAGGNRGSLRDGPRVREERSRSPGTARRGTDRTGRSSPGLRNG